MGVSEFENIISILEKSRVQYGLFVHGPARTSLESARARGTELRQGTKSLLLKGGTGFVLALVSAGRKLDTAKLEKLVGVKRLRFASPEEVLQETGCEVGAVPPFGLKKDVPTYLDRSVLENGEIAFNVGLRTHSIKIRSADLLKIIHPIIGDFSKERADNPL